MTKAIRIQKPGGPEVMEWTDVTLVDPGPGEARVRIRAAGLNFMLNRVDCRLFTWILVAERIRAAVAQLALPHAASATEAHVTVSIGGTTVRPGEGLTPAALATSSPTWRPNRSRMS